MDTTAFSEPATFTDDEVSEASHVPGRLDLARLAQSTLKMTRASFCARYRAIFLLQIQEIAEKADEELSVRFPTVVMASARFRTAKVGLPPYAYPLEKRARANAFALMVTVGRAANNDIVIPDPSVSKFHASLARDEAGRWTITDWSTNGTWVDGERLLPRIAHPIGPGVMVTLAGRIPLMVASAPDVFDMLETARESSEPVARAG